MKRCTKIALACSILAMILSVSSWLKSIQDVQNTVPEVYPYGERIILTGIQSSAPFPDRKDVLNGDMTVAKVERPEELSPYLLFTVTRKYTNDEAVRDFLAGEFRSCLNTANQVYLDGSISPTSPLNLTIEIHVRSCVEKKLVNTGLTVKYVYTYF